MEVEKPGSLGGTERGFVWLGAETGEEKCCLLGRKMALPVVTYGMLSWYYFI